MSRSPSFLASVSLSLSLSLVLSLLFALALVLAYTHTHTRPYTRDCGALLLSHSRTMLASRALSFILPLSFSRLLALVHTSPFFATMCLVHSHSRLACEYAQPLGYTAFVSCCAVCHSLSFHPCRHVCRCATLSLVLLLLLLSCCRSTHSKVHLCAQKRTCGGVHVRGCAHVKETLCRTENAHVRETLCRTENAHTRCIISRHGILRHTAPHHIALRCVREMPNCA